jgi:hypothetical protein
MMQYRGGLIHQIPKELLGRARNKNNYTQQQIELVKSLNLPNIKDKIDSKFLIYGSSSYRLQPFPADIDSGNICYINANYEDATQILMVHIQIIKLRLLNYKRGRIFTDFKAGVYKTGEAIHWKPHEILQGYRDYKIPDTNGVKGKANLYESLQDKRGIVKMDIIAPYFNKYSEVSCMYSVKSNEGYITKEFKIDEIFFNTLIQDTNIQLKKGKIFKVIKRIYSNAKLRRDTSMLKLLEPLINSNLSNLSSIKADIATISLFLEQGKVPTRNLINRELNMIKFKIDNILDIPLDIDKLDKQIDELYNNIVNKDIEKSLKISNTIAKELDNIVNEETIKYLESIGITSFNQFGNKYINFV